MQARNTKFHLRILGLVSLHTCKPLHLDCSFPVSPTWLESSWLWHSHTPTLYDLKLQPFSRERLLHSRLQNSTASAQRRRAASWVDREEDLLIRCQTGYSGRSYRRSSSHEDTQYRQATAKHSQWHWPQRPAGTIGATIWSKVFGSMDLLKTFQSPNLQSSHQNSPNWKWSWNVIEVKQENNPNGCRWLQYRCDLSYLHHPVSSHSWPLGWSEFKTLCKESSSKESLWTTGANVGCPMVRTWTPEGGVCIQMFI